MVYTHTFCFELSNAALLRGQILRPTVIPVGLVLLMFDLVLVLLRTLVLVFLLVVAGLAMVVRVMVQMGVLMGMEAIVKQVH